MLKDTIVPVVFCLLLRTYLPVLDYDYVALIIGVPVLN